MLAIEKRYHWITFHIVLAGAFFLSGCDHGPTPVAISGTVSYQGQPITEGKIFFADVHNSVATGTGNIKDGRYDTEVFPGEKRVRINASYKTGKTLDGPMGVKIEEVIDLIPPKYNMNSTLVRTVEPKGNGVLDFSLE